jgi:hypothetical protein
MADDLRADLDQLLPQAGQRPRLRRLGHRQRPHEIAKVVRQGMKLQANRIGGEGSARQPGPFDRTLTFLYPEKQQNRGSFFDDFEIFVLVRRIWEIIIQDHMPRPDDELLDKVSREWDISKAASPRTATQAAAREWLIRYTPLPHGVTLAHLLAGTFGPALGKSSENREPTGDPPAVTPESSATEMSIPPIGGLGQVLGGLTQSEGNAGSAVWPIGSLAKVIEGLIPAKGSVRAAAGEVSRLAQLLAEATEDAPAGDPAVPRIDPDTDVGDMPT